MANSDKYTRFISSLEIVSITFPKVNWELKAFPSEGDKYEFEPNLDLDDPEIIGDNSIAVFNAHFSLEANIEEEKENFLEMYINLEFVIKFNPKYYSKNILKTYKFKNGIMSIMSILREQVRTATFQMGLPQLILPTFKILPEKEQSKKKVSQSKQLKN